MNPTNSTQQNGLVQLQSIQYEVALTTAAASLAPSISVTSITRSEITATVTAASPHNLLKGQQFTISGANQTEYNGDFRVKSVVSATVFTYEVKASAVSPATGTLVLDVSRGFQKAVVKSKTGTSPAVTFGPTIAADFYTLAAAGNMQEIPVLPTGAKGWMNNWYAKTASDTGTVVVLLW